MFKKALILGLALLVIGGAALAWLLFDRSKEQREINSYKLKYGSEPDKYLKHYNEWLKMTPQEQAQMSFTLGESERNKTKTQLQQEQQERLKADLDKLAVDEIGVYPFADILYGGNWRQDVSRYKKQKELKEIIFNGSIVFVSIGGAVCGLCVLLCAVKILARGLSYSREHIFHSSKSRKKADAVIGTPHGESDQEDLDQELSSNDQAYQFRKHSKAGANFDCRNLDDDFAGRDKQTASKPALFAKEKFQGGNGKHRIAKKHANTLSIDSAGRVATLFSDDKSVEYSGLLRTSDSNENSPGFESSVKRQTENLEKQMEQFRQMAQSVQQTTLEHSKPINNTLQELIQQVSAIREYAANQQDRVEKLQDGYDWNIIRTFCLRVIRCIDNLESRITRLSKKKVDTAHLREVQDELIFALESSGVERFKLEIDSDYRGQEKFAEAVKAKQKCDDPSRTGKIAKIIRPGYQYFINEENVKVVRTAQVKLFG